MSSRIHAFLMSEVIHGLLGKVKKLYRNSFTVKGIWYGVKYKSNFFHVGNRIPPPYPY